MDVSIILTIFLQLFITAGIGFGIYLAWGDYVWNSLFEDSFWPTGVGATVVTILGIIFLVVIWYIPYGGIPEWLADFLQYTRR